MPLLQATTWSLADRSFTRHLRAMRRRGCPARWLAKFVPVCRRFRTLHLFPCASGRGGASILSGRPKLKYYEAGMDLGMSYDRAESFRLFQARIPGGV